MSQGEKQEEADFVPLLTKLEAVTQIKSFASYQSINHHYITLLTGDFYPDILG
jgi:hypothetical protein